MLCCAPHTPHHASNHMHVRAARTSAHVLHTAHAHTAGFSGAKSALWKYWTFTELRDWSVWLCRNVQYRILDPWQEVCFDRCTKAYKRQSGAGTCEAHWVWIDSCWALRCVSNVGRQLSLRGLLYSCMLKYSGSPVLNTSSVTTVVKLRIWHYIKLALPRIIQYNFLQ